MSTDLFAGAYGVNEISYHIGIKESIMTSLLTMLLVMATLLTCGCGKTTQDDKQSSKETQDDKQSNEETQSVILSGIWQGNISEKGRSSSVELSLQEQEGEIGGTLAFRDGTVEGNLAIVQVERTSDHLKFILPIGGEGDEDNVAFDLRIQGNRLEGYGHELREGSENLPVTFTKK